MEETMWKEMDFDSAYALKNEMNNFLIAVSLRVTVLYLSFSSRTGHSGDFCQQEYIQSVTERCGKFLGATSTYQNKKKCPYQHDMEKFSL
jgi:hypothetical protein